MSKKIVLALGGNALGKTPSEQEVVCRETAKAIADLVCEGHQVIVCHGNGPQVGMIQKAMTALYNTDPENYEMVVSTPLPKWRAAGSMPMERNRPSTTSNTVAENVAGPQGTTFSIAYPTESYSLERGMPGSGHQVRI